jgi:hypothetical protein
MEYVISDGLLIGPEWKEIRPSEPLIVEKENQFVSIIVSPPFSAFSKANGITGPNGEVITPEIRVICSDGTEYPMTYLRSTLKPGLFGSIEYASYGFKDGLPKSVKIVKIILRSDVPIPAKKVLWTGFDWKDVR